MHKEIKERDKRDSMKKKKLATTLMKLKILRPNNLKLNLRMVLSGRVFMIHLKMPTKPKEESMVNPFTLQLRTKKVN